MDSRRKATVRWAYAIGRFQLRSWILISWVEKRYGDVARTVNAFDVLRAISGSNQSGRANAQIPGTPYAILGFVLTPP